jgi:HEAT repeat protein
VVRAKVQSLLVRMGEKSFEEDLIEGLDSDLGLVRAAAVEALLGLDQSRAFHERYLVDSEPDVRRAIVVHLASHALPWSQDLLLDAARKDPDVGVRSAAMRALDPGSQESRDVLRKAIETDDGPLRNAAARALGTSSGSMELTWAAHLLALPVTEEGIHFASALIETDKGRERASAYLQEALHDPSPTVRLTTLVELTGARMNLDGLDELASDPSAQVRVAWCRLTRKLGTSKPKQRLQILEAVAGDKEAGREALVALAEEKGGYVKVRARVWWLLRDGTADEQRYVLVHAVRPFGDPSLAIWGMKAKDAEVRILAAAAWLTRK